MLAIPNFDQIFPHWWSHIISYNKTLIGMKFYREVHTVLQCFRYSKTNTTPIMKFWIRQIILLCLVHSIFRFSFFCQSVQKRKNQLSCLFISCIKNLYCAFIFKLLISVSYKFVRIQLDVYAFDKILLRLM